MDGNLSTVEQNVSVAIQKVTQNGQEIVSHINEGIFWKIQPLLDKLYSTSYGDHLSKNIFGVPIGNIIIASLSFILIIILRGYFSRFLSSCLLFFARKTKTKIDDYLVVDIQAPIKFLFTILAFDLFFQFTFIDNTISNIFLNTLIIIDIFWFLYSLTPTLNFLIFNKKQRKNISNELKNFIIRLIRIVIIMIAFITILDSFGVDVSALIASLGLGGLVFALAAKDTASNLFGSIAIMLDHSIKIGEWIKVNGAEGTVEDIGMRTTKIRTFEKSIIVVPNSIVATSNIENFSRRGVRRIKMVIGITYSTNVSQIENIVKNIRQMLRGHPNIAKNQTLLVYFDRFDDSSLGIFIYAFTNTSDWEKYLQIREDINLKIIQIVQNAGSDFAFPSHTLYVEDFPRNLKIALESRDSKIT